MVGIYKDESLQSALFPSVAKAKQAILPQDALADYLPIDGLAPFCSEVGGLLFGEKLWEKERERIYVAQAVGGTSALRLGGEFLVQHVTRELYIPDPTWPNHRQIFEKAGCRVASYPYYDWSQKGLDFEGMCRKLESLPEGTVVVLHACCHNPSGSDPTFAQWKQLSTLFKQKKLLPFFDCAYQGLGSGLEKDTAAIRLFLEEGHELLVAYSCSKNFSLYCQRVGAIFVVGESSAVKARIGSQMKRVIRTLYSNPPAHGAKIVAEVLKQGALRKEWEKDLEKVRHRIISTREDLRRRLISQAKRTDFGYLRHHEGLFLFLSLSKEQVQQLIGEYGIYLLDSGRINVVGLTHQNIDYVVEALLKVVEP